LEKRSKNIKDKESPSVGKTICCYCGVGCGIVLKKEKTGYSLQGDPDYPVNKGALCSKGLNLHHTLNDRSDRLLFPEMRYNKNMPLKRVSWDEALDRTVAVFKTLIEKFGPDSVAFYASGQCLTEEYYVINKLIKGFIGSNNIDTNSRLCMSSAVSAYKLSLGEDSVPLCYDDLDLADCFFVTGANPAWCHPILWKRVEERKKEVGVKLIVVDPRKTDSSSLADLHLQIHPGTDISLHHALGRLIIEGGGVDYDFIQNHLDGFMDYEEKVFSKTLKEYAEITGVPEEDIQKAAKYIRESTGFISLWTMGLNQSAMGVGKNLSLINLSLITGKIGRPGSGPFSLTGQPNAMGGREVGGLSNLLPSHRNLLNPDHRKEVETYWNSGPISPKAGLSAIEMFKALDEGKLKAIWILCTNPITSLPNARFVEQALKKARYVVVQEISNKPSTLQFADVIFPAAGWGEKEGTMTNSERRISYLSKILDPPGEALPDFEIICRFAKKMGYKGFDYKNAGEVFKEHAQLTQKTHMDISGLNYEIIQHYGSVQWPYKKKGLNPGTSRLFTDFKFFTENGRAKLHSVDEEITSEKLNPQFPFILTTGRIRDQWHTMSKTGKVNRLNQHYPESFLEIHPDNAAELGIQEGDLCQIRSRRGEVRVKSKISPGIKKGLVFLPMHWGRILSSDLHRANNLSNDLMDPVSKEPDLKFCAVNVEKYKKPFQKIVLVGAGAASYAFVKALRKGNPFDKITVFSKEAHPFYNRILLPDYISGEKSWSEMQKLGLNEEDYLNIELKCKIEIDRILPDTREVLDTEGNRTSYDILILATGSRASIPKHTPDLAGIFTMRSREDADNFKMLMTPSSHVVIVGGGLLGLEMAASLRELKIRVTIVHRISRFLNRQLDVLGSKLLHEEMEEQGCDIYYDDEVESYYGKTKVLGIWLKSGRKILCDAVLLATGTIPNIELAKECGIPCKKGILVNSRMQTQNPDIFAIGEIAEFEGQLFGISSAAEQQAEVLARYINGDIASFYSGSLPISLIKIHGFHLCSMGMVETPDDPAYEEILFIDKAKRYYKKCIIHQDRLVGAILIGDKGEFAEFREWMDKKLELSNKRLELLRSGKVTEPILGKLICSCNQIGKGNLEKVLEEEVSKGEESFIKTYEDLAQKTGAGMGCGSCRSEVKNIWENFREIKNQEELAELKAF